MKRTSQAILLVWLVIGVSIIYLASAVTDSRSVAEQAIRDRAASYAALVVEHAAATLDRTDIALALIIDHLRAQELVEPKRLSAVRRREIETMLVAHARRVANVDGVVVIDAGGTVIANASGVASGQYLGDRDYFAILKREPSNGPVMSKASAGRVSGKWGVQIARRIDLPDGRFGGVVAANVDVAANFGSFYATLGLGDNSSISLNDAGNHVLVRHPHVPEMLGKAITDTPLARRIVSGEARGWEEVASAVDGIERAYAFGRLPRYPIYAVLGLSVDHELSGWRVERNKAAGGVLVLFLAGGFITGLLRRNEAARNALARSEERWKFALEGAGHGVWDRNLQTGEAVFSKRYLEMYGYAEGELGSRTGEWAERVHPDDLPRVLADRQAYLDGRTSAYTDERRMRCKNGSWKWVLVRGIVVSRDAAGRPLRMIGTHTDVTESKLLSEEARKNHELLIKLSEQVPGIIFQYRLYPDGRSCFPFISDAIHDLYGLTQEQAAEDANQVFVFQHPEDAPGLMASIQESARTLETWHHEYRAIFPGQGVRWRSGHARPEKLADGSVLWHGFITDITERKRAELERQASIDRTWALLSIAERGGALPEKELLTYGLEQAERLTGSGMAFLHLVNEDQETIELVTWSAKTMAHCEAVFDRHYPIAQAGIWADCLRERQAVVVNDYAGHPGKRGLPEGHAPLHRLISVPVFEEGKVRLILGVGNKHTEYEPYDVETLQLIGNDLCQLTDRMRAEAELDASKKMLQTIIDNAPALIYGFDTRGRGILSNRGLETAVSRTREQLIGSPRSTFLTSELAAAHDRNDARVIASGKPLSTEEENLEPDGLHIYHTVKFPILDAANHLIGVGGISSDITERKRTEAAIRRTADRTSALLRLNEIGPTLPENRLIRMGLEEAERLTASKVAFFHFVNEDEETVQLQAWTSSTLAYCKAECDGHYPISKAGIWANCVRIKQPTVFNDYANYSRKRGLPEGHAELQRVASVPVIEDGKVRAILGVGNKDAAYDPFDVETAQIVGNDIWRMVSRTRIEEQLRNLSRAVEQSPAAIVITDRTGNIEYVNPRFEAVTGYSRAEAIGQNPRILKSGKTSAHDYAQMWRTIAAGGEWRGELCNRKKTGELFWEYASISGLIDDTGQIRHFVAVKEDITERKSMVDEIRALNQNLEQRVIARTRELERANRELDAFSYSVSHDLRAPLRSINGFAGMLSEDEARHLSAVGQELLGKIRHNAERMAQMIDDLLRLSRIGREDLTTEAVDLNAVVREVIASLRAAYPETEIVVEELPGANCDRGLVRQVFENLISNAFKYSSKRKKPKVEIGSRTEDGKVVIFVRDNGAGFDMQYAGKLFEVFQRLHREVDFPGTGVGLVLVRRVVERHGGRVWAESAPGEGATFSFSLGSNSV